MASTTHAQVRKAAPQEEMLPAKLPVLNIMVLSSGKKRKIQIHNNSLKLTKLREYDACFVTNPLDYQQRWVKLPLLRLADD